MATLNTNMLSLPGTSLGIVADTAAQAGILGRLSPEKPTIFGPVKGAVFTNPPRAEIVGESEQKSSTGVTLTPFSAEPIKLHVAVRTSDEFLIADEDYQLGLVNDLISPALGNAIGRGVDLMTFHGINPATGQVSGKLPKYLTQTTNIVKADGKPTQEIVEAVGLAGGTTNGVAFDGSYLFELATQVNPVTGVELNPGLGFGSDIANWRGLNAAKSTTVSGQPELADTGIKAIAGDWSQVRWGFQRDMGVEILRWGDPDGQGRDLAGHNEVLLRAEAIVYVAVGDLSKFALVKHDAA